MATARMAAIADAVVTEIAALSLPSGATALSSVARLYVHDFGEADDTTFRCSVTALTETDEQETRGLQRSDTGVIVTISKRVDDTANATIDPLILTVEAIMDLYATPHRLSGSTTASATGQVEAMPIFDPALLDTQRMFVAVLSFTVGNWS